MMSPCEVQEFAEMLRSVGGYSSFSITPYTVQDLTVATKPNVVFFGDVFLNSYGRSIIGNDFKLFNSPWLGGSYYAFSFWYDHSLYVRDVYFSYAVFNATIIGNFSFWGYVITYY